MVNLTPKQEIRHNYFAPNKADLRRQHLQDIFTNQQFYPLRPLLINVSKGMPPSLPQAVYAQPILQDKLAKLVYPDKTFSQQSIEKVFATEKLRTTLLEQLGTLYKQGILTNPPQVRLENHPSSKVNKPPLPYPPVGIPLDVLHSPEDEEESNNNSFLKDPLTISLIGLAGISAFTVSKMYGHPFFKDQSNTPPTAAFLEQETLHSPQLEVETSNPIPIDRNRYIPAYPDVQDKTSSRFPEFAPLSTINFSTVPDRRVSNEEYSKIVGWIDRQYSPFMEKTIQNSPLSYDQQKVETLKQNYNTAVEAFKGSHQLQDYYKAVQAVVEISHEVRPQRQTEKREVWMGKNALSRLESPEAVKRLVSELVAANYTSVNLEASNGGYAVFNSNYFQKHPKLANQNFDAFGEFVNEANAQGLKVNAWVWMFAAGYNIHENAMQNLPPNENGPLLGEVQGLTQFRGQSDEHFLDPTNPTNREFILNAYKELVSNYAVDGLIMDYIRYPSGNDGHKDPAVITNFIANDFVPGLKQINPNLEIGAAVFPEERSKRLNAIGQDWESWFASIDTLYPMTYYDKSAPAFQNTVQEIVQKAEGTNTDIIPVIGLFNFVDNKTDLVDFMDASPNAYSLFALDGMQENPELFKMSLIGSTPYQEY